MLTEGNILLFLMVLFRIASFFTVIHVFFPAGTPKYLKLLFSLLMSFIIFPMITTLKTPEFNNAFSIVYYGGNEILIGIVMGYVTNVCFNFIKMAGQYLDVHIGFAMSTLFDPTTNENVTLIEKLMNLTAILFFLMLDGHHILIKTLINSYKVIGVGKSILISQSFSKIIDAFIYFFILGIRISLPITLVILLINLILGLASRAVPQLNVMILGMPLKIAIGIFTFIVGLPLMFKLFTLGFQEIPKHILHILKLAPVAFVFADNGDKTEEATPKKKSDARKKGQVAKSKEVSMTLTLICLTFVLMVFGDFVFNEMKNIMQIFLNNYLKPGITFNMLKDVLIISLERIAIAFLPIAIPILIIGVCGNLIQTGFLFTKDPLKPNFAKLNPIEGFKKLFSVRSLAEMIKSISIISILLYVGYNFAVSNFNDVMIISNLSFNVLPSKLNKLVGKILFKFSLTMSVISVMDYVFQYRQHKKDLKMSKQEIKEEFKQMEGDPQIKSKIRQKQREMAMRRMMQSVPDATVVITNPTHFAVALKYENDGKSAPKVVAKGADRVALKIKEIALENKVPIFENKMLARTIYDTVELENEIPQDLYQAVAEILALVYKLKK